MYYEIFQLHAKLLKALANSKRLEIFQLLRNQEMNVADMQTMLALPQANLSQHLTVLRHAGVVKTRRDGKEIYYSVSHKNYVRANDLFRKTLIASNKDKVSDIMFHKMSDLVPLTVDPVCGMRLSPQTSAFASTGGGHEYFFCGSGCYETFRKNPTKFIPKGAL